MLKRFRNWRFADEVVLFILIVALAGAVFVFFRTFFENDPDDLTIEILAALLGSILTVMITMLLMKRQGSLEEAKEAATTNKTKIFEKKLELFRDFISAYVRCAADGVLTREELQELEELALVISLFTKDVEYKGEIKDFGEELCRFILQLQICGLSNNLDAKQTATYDKYMRDAADGKLGEMLSFADILRMMKYELGIVSTDIDWLFFEDEKNHDFDWAEKLLEYRDYRGEGKK